MFIHDSLDTTAFSISPALDPDLVFLPDLLGPLPSVKDWDYKEVIPLLSRS